MASRIQGSADSSGSYIARLQGGFGQYRRERFSGRDHLFEDCPGGGPVVFRKEHAASNLLIPPILDDLRRGEAFALIPASQRHQWFHSLQSFQALAQSIFGTIAVSGRLPILADIVAENGLPAFGPVAAGTVLELEKSITTLGEPRPTSIDV